MGMVTILSMAVMFLVLVGRREYSYDVYEDGAAATTTTTAAAVVLVRHEPVVARRAEATTGRTPVSRGLARLLVTEVDEETLVAQIAEKLKPSSIRFVEGGEDDYDYDYDYDYDDDEEEGQNAKNAKSKEENKVETITATKKKPKQQQQQQQIMEPHQFLHLHHMKTGGTSIDQLLRCAIGRLKKVPEAAAVVSTSKGTSGDAGDSNGNSLVLTHDVPYYSIHECSRSRFTSCLTEKENACRPRMNEAAVMSYCGALKYLDEFGWWHNKNAEHTIKAFTVLRNPVDRVWSMFRFQTKNCYQCTPLKDIYKSIDAGTMTQDYGLDKLCTDQIQNHEVANLLSTKWPLEVTDIDTDDENHQRTRNEMIQEAIENMKHFFTVIGITEELVETAAILGKVIPWMNETVTTTSTTETCPLSHANASPKNNRCGDKNTHWDLPDKPDEETYNLILKHNAMDMELYEAAVAYFELQKRALEMI